MAEQFPLDVQLSSLKQNEDSSADQKEDKPESPLPQSISLSIENNDSKPKKQPRRILHFSDGTLEEYSTDEETDSPPQDEDKNQALIDLKALTWKPWLWYWMAYSSNSALTFCDYVGESLANFFGITSPKYQYEIDEYHRSIAEEEEEKKQQDLENAGWTKNTEENTSEIPQTNVSTDETHKSYQSISSAVLNCNQNEGEEFSNIAELQPQIVITGSNDAGRY